MQQGKATEHQLKRIMRSINHELHIHPIEEPKVVVKYIHAKSDEEYIVNIEELTCTCEDMKYNCSDGQYCKHIFHVVFKKHDML
jgi:predicted nucleic acid-binding Zn finger protein